METCDICKRDTHVIYKREENGEIFSLCEDCEDLCRALEEFDKHTSKIAQATEEVKEPVCADGYPYAIGYPEYQGWILPKRGTK